MTESIHLSPRHIQASNIHLPGSKSISNRTLLLAALSNNHCEIHSLLRSDDTNRMLDALTALGTHIHYHDEHTLTIQGNQGQFPQKEADLFLGNAGTAFRPLTAALAILGGNYHLHGIPRMHERPIGDLVDALRLSGADIHYLGNEGFPPLQIGQFQANDIDCIPIKGNVSSQFLTALLMALPLTGKAYQIKIIGELISKPYIDITLNLMSQFGIQVENQAYQHFHIPANSQYHAPEIVYIEGDASSASYFLAAGFLTGTPITVNGIGLNSIQGDVAFAKTLEVLGAEIEWGANHICISRPTHQPIPAFQIDANHIPDAAMTLAIVALAAKGRSSITNIGSWRVKETDRIHAMATELRKLGATVEEEAEAIHITPADVLTPNVAIDTYDDHRMAMCFSLVSLLNTPITINDPQCTHKTFPTYFDVFNSLSQS